jgi:PLP dependent protein
VKTISEGQVFRKRACRPKQVAVLSTVQKLEMQTPSALAEIEDRITRAAAAVSRTRSDVTLVAVSKQQPWEAIAPVLAAGQLVFGENRVQEAEDRWGGDRKNLKLHLIGSLQSNKVSNAVALFDVIETLDREKIVKAVADEVQRQGKSPQLYIQINTGEEPQKAGVIPPDADAFVASCRQRYGLGIEGLMCIPPADQPAGPHFALLAKIAARNGLAGLSMGMSQDFELAIRLGATSVRVGSAIFGARH